MDFHIRGGVERISEREEEEKERTTFFVWTSYKQRFVLTIIKAI